MAQMFTYRAIRQWNMLSQELGFMTFKSPTNSANLTNLGSLQRTGPLEEAGSFKTEQFLMDIQEVDNTQMV